MFELRVNSGTIAASAPLPSMAPALAAHMSAREYAPAAGECLPSLQGSQYSAASSFQTGVSGGCLSPRSSTSETRPQRLHWPQANHNAVYLKSASAAKKAVKKVGNSHKRVGK